MIHAMLQRIKHKICMAELTSLTFSMLTVKSLASMGPSRDSSSDQGPKSMWVGKLVS